MKKTQDKRPNMLTARFSDKEYAKLLTLAKRMNVSCSRVISTLVSEADMQQVSDKTMQTVEA